MANHKQKRRFIAGAVCPECKQLDTIIMFPDTKTVRCTRCDYMEIMTEDRSQQTPVDTATSVIRFVDPGGSL